MYQLPPTCEGLEREAGRVEGVEVLRCGESSEAVVEHAAREERLTQAGQGGRGDPCHVQAFTPQETLVRL